MGGARQTRTVQPVQVGGVGLPRLPDTQRDTTLRAPALLFRTLLVAVNPSSLQYQADALAFL